MNRKSNKKVQLMAIFLIMTFVLSSNVMFFSFDDFLNRGESMQETEIGQDNGFQIENIGHEDLTPPNIAAQNVWWDYSWRYRVPINITHENPATLEEFQVLIEIDLNDWINNGEMQEDGDDIRFTDSTNTVELYYWIEEFGGVGEDTEIWVRVPELSTDELIYMYFGNEEAQAASSLDDTMDEGFRYFYYHSTTGNRFNDFRGTDVHPNAPYFTFSGGTIVQLEGNTWEDRHEYLAIRFEGWIINNGEGTHDFRMFTDDGIRIYVDGGDDLLIGDGWRNQARTQYDTSYVFSSPVSIVLEWYENTGSAVCELGWNPPGGDYQMPIPGSHLRNRK